MPNEAHLDLIKRGVRAWNEWRKRHPDIIPDLSEAALRGEDLYGVNFSNTDLRGANFSETDLTRADFIGANLSDANFTKAILHEAFLWEANLTEANLTEANLYRAELIGANLIGADLTKANLHRAELIGANLIRASLIQTIALETNFKQAILTGACLEDWHTNKETNLEDVLCEYVYLQREERERRPSSGNFALGDFTKLFEKVLDTVDLIFRNGVDWNAFFCSFKQLQDKCDSSDLSLQSFENKNDGAFVIRVNVPRDADKAVVEEYLKQEYELRAADEKYRNQLQARDEQIALYRQQSADLMEIAKLLASRTINVEAIAVSESKSMSEGPKKISKNDLRGATFAGGFVDANTVQAGQIGGDIHNYAPEQRQNLAEAAAEIQQLLQQLEQTYPTSTPREKQIVVAEAIERIENNPALKVRVIGALKAGGTEALKELVDHPLINILLATLEGWQQAE